MKFRFAKRGQPQPGSKPRACPPMKLFPTALVGSYPQPDWLIDRQMLSKRMPPRIRAEELWRGSAAASARSEEHTSELQSHLNLVCRLLLEKKKIIVDYEIRCQTEYAN